MEKRQKQQRQFANEILANSIQNGNNQFAVDLLFFQWPLSKSSKRGHFNLHLINSHLFKQTNQAKKILLLGLPRAREKRMEHYFLLRDRKPIARTNCTNGIH